MEIFEDFNQEVYKRTGKYYHEFNIINKIKILDEAEIILAKIAARRRAVIRRLRKELRSQL